MFLSIVIVLTAFLFLSAVHSFILDIDDEVIRQHFSEVELNEIDSVSGPQVPELSSDVIDCLSKFIDKVIF